MDVPTLLDLFVSYGFETDDEMTDARKLEALNETYWDACSREGWPFLEMKEGFAVDGAGLITPASGTEVASVQAVWFSTSGRVLRPIRLDDLNQSNPTWASLSDNPVYYYFIRDHIYVAPIPAADPGDGQITYLQKPAELAALGTEADIIIPKQYHRSVLAMGTLSRLAMMQDDPDMAAAYERLYEKALVQMASDLLVRQTDQPDYIHVNDPDNWDYS